MADTFLGNGNLIFFIGGIIILSNFGTSCEKGSQDTGVQNVVEGRRYCTE